MPTPIQLKNRIFLIVEQKRPRTKTSCPVIQFIINVVKLRFSEQGVREMQIVSRAEAGNRNFR